MSRPGLRGWAGHRGAGHRWAGRVVAAVNASLLTAGSTMILLYAIEHPGTLAAHTLVPLFYDVPLALAFAVVSTVILRRMPTHPVGWLFALVGIAISVGFFAEGYAAWSPPGTTWVLWLWTIGNGPIFFGLAMALLIFPTGQPPSRRWRVLAGLLWLYLGAAVLACAVVPWPREEDFLVIAVQERRGWPDPNPVGWDGQEWLSDATALVVPGGALLLVASLLSQLPRWRRSAGDERQQIKWLGLAALLATIEITGGVIQSLTGQMPADDPAADLVGNAIFVLLVAGLPVAVGLGIVRYRLYDIDSIISKTLVYGGLAAFIGLAYVVGVVLVGELVGRWAGSSTVLALAATAVVATAFHPLRTRLRVGADRMVFGRRAAPYELMTRFGHSIGQAVAHDDVLARIAETAGRAARARAARVTATLPSGEVLAARWPAVAAPASPPLDLVVPVRHEGATIAEISVSGDNARVADVALLRHTAAISAGALRNLRLVAELESLQETILRQNEDVAASRSRLAAADQEERLRLERMVTERIGPDLAALRDALRALWDGAEWRPDAVVTGCERLAARAIRVADELRALSRGVLPPLLVDHGLAAALRALVRRLDRDITLHLGPSIDGTSIEGVRFPTHLETTTYLCCRAALVAVAATSTGATSTAATSTAATSTAATSTAATSRADLRVWRDDATLAFSVTHSAPRTAGDELTALMDRVATLGGELLISPLDGWSTLICTLPLELD